MRSRIIPARSIQQAARGTAAASSQTAAVYKRLRDDLLSCRLRPGQRLHITELARALSASQGAVREALSRLTSEDLVVAEPQRGFRATPISAADLTDLTRTRIQVETQCLQRAIEVGSIAWESALVAAHHQLARVPAARTADPARVDDEWARLHAEFHEALVAACDSPWLLRLRRLLFAHSERYRRLSLPLGRKTRRVDHEHAELLAATLARDVDRATRLLCKHLEMTTAALIELKGVTGDSGERVNAPRRKAKSANG